MKSILSACLTLLAWTASLQADEGPEAFFETNIRPVLIEQCFECHGQGDVESGLRVDSRETLLSGGDRGPAITEGDAAKSLLFQAIRHSDELQMPPDAPLTEQQVADFEQWINAGAHWPAYDGVRIRAARSSSPSIATAPDHPNFKDSLQVWFKADGQPWQEGQSVPLWQDSSGRGHDLAATAGARPGGVGQPGQFITSSRVNGFPAVRFDMNTGYGGNAATAPEITGDAEFTMFVVIHLDSVPDGSDGLIVGFGEPAPPANPLLAKCAIIGISDANPRPILVGGWGNDASPTSTSDGEPLLGRTVILALTKQAGPLAGTARFHVNSLPMAELTGSNEIPDFGRRGDLGFFMGHARDWLRGFEGDVAEVAVYNRALGDEERQAMEAHFSVKYRIPLSRNRSEDSVAMADPAFHKPHWSFAPIRHPEPPQTVGVESEHPIDAFIREARDERGLHPVPAAETHTLVRRLYFDLLGLPPTPEQMQDAIVRLTPWSDSAWAALIDELLASPHYGERWGRHWLDVARYADTAGDNADYPVPEARYYRDYVIDAFNADMPYDQFVREQLAGDILAREGPRDRYAAQVSATGFLALSRRYATGPYELWHLTLEDTIDTVGQAFIGVTMRCARCHDHKFDPITQQDYYALYGIFESTQFPWAGAEEFHSKQTPRLHFVSLLPEEEAEPLRAAFEQSAQSVDMNDAEAVARITAANKTGYPPEVPSAYAVREGQPRPAVLQISGDPGSPGPIVARGVPTFLPTMQDAPVPDEESGRRQLAEWLTRPDHPLTARVMVNRIWQHHFGQGIVATPSNFGLRGSPPSHLELLDWLASRFIEEGWSIKSMHRLILTSETWRLSSTNDADNAAIDPANEFLWRHDRQRLDAESIRDAMLAISGRLDLNRPGEHPFPPITSWTYTQHTQFHDFYPSTHRSVYLMTTRLQRHPFLALFDGPDTNTTTERRSSSIVPSQALYLMNSEEVRTEADAFARRVLEVPHADRLARAYSLAFQREPTPTEIHRAENFIAQYTTGSNETAAWTAFCRSMLVSHEAFYLD